MSIVAEQFVRMLHHVGMPKEDMDYIHGDGRVVNEILNQARPRNTLFTGSGRIAEKLALDMKGKVCISAGLHLPLPCAFRPSPGFIKAAPLGVDETEQIFSDL